MINTHLKLDSIARALKGFWSSWKESFNEALMSLGSIQFETGALGNILLLPYKENITEIILGFILHSVWKSQKKISFNIGSEASYVYILSGQKFIKNVKNGRFWRVL